MLLDLRRLFASYEAPVHRDLEFDFSQESFSDYQPRLPACVHLTVEKEGSAMHLCLAVSVSMDTQCARCLDDAVYTADFSREFFIRDHAWTQEDTELPLSADGKLDVRELAYTELVLELPRAVLCKPNCEGLCPVCGARNPCACTQETHGATDERLSILQQLLSE